VSRNRASRGARGNQVVVAAVVVVGVVSVARHIELWLPLLRHWL